jgi:guanylate kinase
VPGVSYHFLSRADFEQGIQNDQFLEWQETHGNLYGTPRSSIEPLQAQALDIVSDIDFRGIEFYKRTYPKTVVSIFVVPSKAQELIRRLTLRGDAKGDIATRVATAEREMTSFQSMATVIDYVLINDDRGTTLRHAESIVVAERLRRDRLSAEHLSTICSVSELQSFRAG